ncbi:MAG: ABC-F family ATP-binding cassette domain-containing protein [Sinimarinibacterium flocculans]|uniref:ABC-F family ATP-binding cassette domain-containing protein n=1 Tax=Sinimarinibacterium flocculans TaxID=985250 RepID=UPI003C524284
MTHAPFLTLHGVSHSLPDGRLLFRDLEAHFDHRPTGLVGRNGIGKSVLARILAGTLMPTTGRVLRSGPVHYLAQQIRPRPLQTVAGLAGVQAGLDALARTEAGCAQPGDDELLGERWDLRERLARMLDASGLSHVDADTPVTRLSGGELTRVALAGAFLGGADFLVLDEPSNHLDRQHRDALIEQLRRWPGGLLVVSHDRSLLDSLHAIVELSETGLRRYGGGHAFYARTRAQEHAAAQDRLDRSKAQSRRQARELDRQRERAERRQARGRHDAANANLAPILLGLRKGRSETTSGKLRVQQQAARESLAQQVREAAAAVASQRETVLFAPPAARGPDRVAALTDVTLPHLIGATRNIALSLLRGQRIALVGANGSGKSTLLQVLSGRLAPLGGRCELAVATAYLDQHLSLLDPDRGVLDQLRAINRRTGEGELRSRVALLGLGAAQLRPPAGQLSGGERVRAAMACALYGENPAQLLLLDEPDNHLDLDATAALEAMLRQYDGTLVAASHDPHFLDALAPTHQLEAGAAGWRLTPWQAAAP